MTFMAFFQENIWSFALLTVVIAMLVVVEKKRIATQTPKVSPLGLAAQLNQGAWLIDVRDAQSFKHGHIAGAKNYPKLLEQLSHFHDKNQALILCDEKGLRAPMLANQLKGHGFTAVSVLHGGMQAWLDENYPVVK